jgi:hypothetical protein
MRIQIAQDTHGDDVLTESPFALLCGMLLDQHMQTGTLRPYASGIDVA